MRDTTPKEFAQKQFCVSNDDKIKGSQTHLHISEVDVSVIGNRISGREQLLESSLLVMCEERSERVRSADADDRNRKLLRGGGDHQHTAVGDAAAVGHDRLGREDDLVHSGHHRVYVRVGDHGYRDRGRLRQTLRELVAFQTRRCLCDDELKRVFQAEIKQ